MKKSTYEFITYDTQKRRQVVGLMINRSRPFYVHTPRNVYLEKVGVPYEIRSVNHEKRRFAFKTSDDKNELDLLVEIMNHDYERL